MRKLNSIGADSAILDMFYKSIVQSVLSFSLICVFGSLRSRDKAAFLVVVKQARRITGTQLETPEAIYNAQVCSKVDMILSDPSHPLHNKFTMSRRGDRLLQRRIRTQRFNNSFVPSAVRWYNMK